MKRSQPDRAPRPRRSAARGTRARRGHSRSARFGSSRRAPSNAPPILTLDHVIGEGIRGDAPAVRSEEHTSELQSLMRISYAVFCLKKKKKNKTKKHNSNSAN